jgi:hypothetical protein
VILFDRYGSPIQADGAQKKIDRVLEIITLRAPWALLGFTKEINDFIRSDWHGFVTEIDARRAKAAGA